MYGILCKCFVCVCVYMYIGWGRKLVPRLLTIVSVLIVGCWGLINLGYSII